MAAVAGPPRDQVGGGGVNLQAERLNRGLSVKAAASQINVPWWVLRDAEQGARPRPENAKAIADFYGVLVTDIWPVEQPAPVGVAAARERRLDALHDHQLGHDLVPDLDPDYDEDGQHE